MRAIPIRVRLTIVVALTAAIALTLLATGASNTVEETVTDITLFSTSAALQDAKQVVVTRSDDIVAYLESAGPLLEENAGIETEMQEVLRDDVRRILDSHDESEPGVVVELYDRAGQPIALEGPGGPIVVIDRLVCTTWSPSSQACDSEAIGADGVSIDEELEASLISLVENRPFDGPQATAGTALLWGDTPLVLVVTSSFDSTTTSTGLVGIVLLMVPILILIITGITWLALGRALRPVESITAQVERIGDDSLDQRVPVPPANDQLHDLANTMNKMLDRLQGSRDRQRQFISDASHELRSPITATKATLEVASANPDSADWAQVALVLDEENTRLAHLVDDLLLLAQLDERLDAPMMTVDLDEVCLAEAARPHPVPVVVKVSAPARVEANLAMVTRAVRNLIENAAVHAATRVEVELDLVTGNDRPWEQDRRSDEPGLDSSGPQAVVRVSDDGPGIPVEDRGTIFERFARVDEARTRDSGGAGLGLAIVQKVATNHGGTISVGAGTNGGACFTLTLPPVATGSYPTAERHRADQASES